MIKQKIKSIIISLILSIIYLLIGYLLAFPISNNLHASINDVIFSEGLIITVFSLYFATHKKNPSRSFFGLRSRNSRDIAMKDEEITKKKNEATDGSKSPMNNYVIKLIFSKLTLIFGGILLILCSLIS
jgi:uncharacterized protein YacL